MIALQHVVLQSLSLIAAAPHDCFLWLHFSQPSPPFFLPSIPQCLIFVTILTWLISMVNTIINYLGAWVGGYYKQRLVLVCPFDKSGEFWVHFHFNTIRLHHLFQWIYICIARKKWTTRMHCFCNNSPDKSQTFCLTCDCFNRNTKLGELLLSLFCNKKTIFFQYLFHLLFCYCMKTKLKIRQDECFCCTFTKQLAVWCWKKMLTKNWS